MMMLKPSAIVLQQNGQQVLPPSSRPLRGLDCETRSHLSSARPRPPSLRPSSRSPAGLLHHVAASAAVVETETDGASTVDVITWRDDFSERFSVGEEIGRGCQGVVRRVVSRESGAAFAAKTVTKAGDGRRARAEARFMAMAQASGRVVGIEGVYEDEDNVHVVMELLEGGTLEEWMQRRSKRRRAEEVEAEVAQVISQVLRFLEHCHEKGICYGDIKPANFMLQEGREQGFAVKAIDFGCSQKVVPGVRLRAPAGSPLYMAPEIFLGSYGLEADIWATGVMMFQLLCGKAPFAEYDECGEIVDVGIHVGYSYDGYPWDNISNEAKELIDSLLTRAARKRASAKEALEHPWFAKFTQRTDGENTKGQDMSSIVAAPELHYSVAVCQDC